MKIALECKPDERLVMGLGIPQKKILHQNDKGDVCNFLEKHPGNIGLVDEDPTSSQPKLLNQVKLISTEHGIKYLENNGLRILMICPRLEDWIINACVKPQIKIGDFHLSAKPKDLAKEINYKLNRFDQLVAALVVAQSPGLLRLKSFLK